MTLRYGFVFLIFALGCGSPSSPDNAGPLTLTRLRQDPVSFRYNSGMREAQRLVIRDQATWQQTWNAIWSGTTPIPALPAVDFDREMIIVAALGERATGGFSIFIDGATENANGVVVSVRAVSPGSGCGVTLALTQPVDLARVTRRDGTVTFTESSVVQNCN